MYSNFIGLKNLKFWIVLSQYFSSPILFQDTNDNDYLLHTKWFNFTGGLNILTTIYPSQGTEETTANPQQEIATELYRGIY